jgi:hypothetical protein
MDNECKVCGILSGFSDEAREEINDYILDRTVTAEFASMVLGVAASTVKKHRSRKHV